MNSNGKLIDMKVFYCLIISLFFSIVTCLGQESLINFDIKKHRKRFKKEMIMVAQLDSNYNFWHEVDQSGTFGVINTRSNYAPPKNDMFFLKVLLEDWTYNWLRDKKDLYFYFRPTNNGWKELIGFSTNFHDLKQYNKFDDSGFELIDFTDLKPGDYPDGTYISGSLDIGVYDVYPYIGRNSILLIYPKILEEDFGDLYGHTYQLSHALSASLVQELITVGSNAIVLKSVGNGMFSLVGYIRNE